MLIVLIHLGRIGLALVLIIEEEFHLLFQRSNSSLCNPIYGRLGSANAYHVPSHHQAKSNESFSDYMARSNNVTLRVDG